MTQLASSALLAAILCWSGPAQAASGFLNHRIPASACEPSSEADFDQLILVDGSWEFAEAAEGTVSLVCPVHYVRYLNYPVLDDTIGVMRLWYQDPSGGLTDSNVKVRLFRRPWDGGPVPLTAQWSTDAYPGGILDNRMEDMVVNQIFIMGASHYVAVEMYRFSTVTPTPRMTGIDFTHLPPAP